MLRRLVSLASVIIITGCSNGMVFDESSNQTLRKLSDMDFSIELAIEESNPSPIGDVSLNTEPPQAPPTELPSLSQKTSGSCSEGNARILSCLSCQKSEIPSLEAKAGQLLDILEKGCSTIQNNEREGYQPPSRQELYAKLHACSSELYPLTSYDSAQQSNTIAAMAQDQVLIDRMWTNLFYTPPFSDHFELFFGLEIREARYFFCYDETLFSGKLLTSEYWSYAHDRIFEWESNSQAQARDKKIQKIRSQLISCIQKSVVTEPHSATDTENTANEDCSYETFDGYLTEEALTFARSSLAANSKLFYEVLGENGSCGKIDNLNLINANPNLRIKIAAVSCSP
jgi:hypothetical protein